MTIELADVTYHFPERVDPALTGLRMTVRPGEMLLLVGDSGSGKSTLLRLLAALVPHFYGGRFRGDARFDGVSVQHVRPRDVASRVGIVFQDPEQQFVMDTVERELAFGMENRGMPPTDMNRRIAEVLSFLNMVEWKEATISKLSGGMKQRVAIASALLASPKYLVLDEPTSQLDPIAASEINHLITRLRDEWGMGIVVAEHRVEHLLPMADRVIQLENGAIIFDGRPRAWVATPSASRILPIVTKLLRDYTGDHPFTIRDARAILARAQVSEEYGLRGRDSHVSDGTNLGTHVGRTDIPTTNMPDLSASSVAVHIDNVSYAYGSEHRTRRDSTHSRIVLREISGVIQTGSIVAILGPNGSGKSTLLQMINGLLRPTRGSVKVFGEDTLRTAAEELARRIAYVPQNPNTFFVKDTLWEECCYSSVLAGHAVNRPFIEEVVHRMGLLDRLDINPRDLSGGERQRAVIASVLCAKPSILLLDEPTRGADMASRDRLMNVLQQERADGMTTVLVTHDVDLAAETSDVVWLLFDGKIVAAGAPSDMFAHGLFYRPAIGRVFHDIDASIVRVSDAQKLISEMLPRQGSDR